MKKNSLGGIIVLLLAAVAAAWLNGDGADFSSPQTAQGGNAEYLLALSWQPGFCESRPNKPECRSQRAGRFDVTHFSLHGLWPQPRGNEYCNVPARIVRIDKSGRWDQLPKLDLSDTVRRDLAEKMPGYRSALHRHEWYKHGTCMAGYSPEDYFRISLNLLDQLNASGVRELLASNVGRRLDFRDVEQAFNRSLGAGAGARFILDCYRDDGRRIIQEIKIALSGKLEPSSRLQDLIASAKTTGRSCPGGIVDPVGLQ